MLSKKKLALNLQAKTDVTDPSSYQSSDLTPKTKSSKKHKHMKHLLRIFEHSEKLKADGVGKHDMMNDLMEFDNILKGGSNLKKEVKKNIKEQL